MAADAFINLALVLGLVQLSQRLELEKEDNILYVQIAFMISQSIVFLVYLYIRMSIKNASDKTVFTYDPPKQSMFQTETPEPVSTTIEEYDMGELKKALQASGMSLVILSFIHLKFGYVNPLFIQTFLTLKNLYSAPLVQVHVLKKKTEGKLNRPWVPDSALKGLQEAAAAAKETKDKAAAEIAEKTGGGSNSEGEAPAKEKESERLKSE